MMNIILQKELPDSRRVQAEDASQAITAVTEKGPFDLILTDWEYPVKKVEKPETPDMTGGVAFISHLTRNKIETPFIVLSTRPEQEIRNRLAEDNLRQPFAVLDKAKGAPAAAAFLVDYLKHHAPTTPAEKTSKGPPGDAPKSGP